MVTSLFSSQYNSLRIISTLAMLAIVGCGDSLPANRGMVTGRVTVDGEAVQSGTIALYSPVDAKSLDDASVTANSNIIDGNFSFKSPIGPAKVVIRVPEVVGQKKLYDTPDSPLASITQESLPGKFNSETELTLDVVHGDNKKDFELTTK